MNLNTNEFIVLEPETIEQFLTCIFEPGSGPDAPPDALSHLLRTIRDAVKCPRGRAEAVRYIEQIIKMIFVLYSDTARESYALYMLDLECELGPDRAVDVIRRGLEKEAQC